MAGGVSFTRELALVPRTRAPAAIYKVRDWWVPSYALTGMLALALFAVGMPFISVALIVASSASTVALVLDQHAAARGPLAPEAIASLAARETYRSIVFASAEIKRALSEVPGPASTRIIDRCTAAVSACARVAFLSNPLQYYLDAHDPMILRAELDRLRARTELTTDEPTVAALSRATAARARQLATYQEMHVLRERTQARLELVQASLESFAAQLVKIRLVDEELDSISEDLDVLESALS